MPILEIVNVTKYFGGLRAINDLCMDVREREILGLIGPNGSGKTTLFNLVNGFLSPDKGKIIFNGYDMAGKKPHEICKMGIGRAFQIAKPFINLSVLKNVRSAALNRIGDFKDAGNKALEILQFIKLLEKKDYMPMNLTISEKKRLELARALATQPMFLLLDEVMAGLNPKEAEDLLGLIRKVRESGITILIIEHVMEAIMTLSDRIVVIHHGQKIGEGKPCEIVKDSKVIEAYLGSNILNAED